MRRWQLRLHEIIYEADTPAGKAFDVALLLAIVASVLVVFLDSVRAIQAAHGRLLYAAEWGFTLLFTVEYALRLLAVQRPLRYALSFFGLVDLLSILPTYLSVFIPGSQSLLVIRTLRLLRIFRVLKLGHYVRQAALLQAALRGSLEKIIVFLGTVLSLMVIVGALMYLIEGEQHGFTSVPRSIYWAIVTMTTVGYGDIAPQTVLGQVLASVVMIIGYGIIAVPTGIVSAELMQAARTPVTTAACPACAAQGHDPAAAFCNRCGTALDPPPDPDRPGAA